MSESSDSGQASIVFLGRESFRMQVVADGVPNRLMDMPTERIVDRRQTRERRNASERRKRLQLEAPVEAPVDPWPTPAPTPAWNRVVFVSLATFVSGVLLTMTVDRFTRHARAKMIAQSQSVASAPPPVVQPAAPQPATAPALVVQPIPPPVAEPTTLPAPVAAPAPQSPIDLRPRTLHAVPKVPAARPRQPAATSRVESRAAVIATTPPPLKAPRAKWVDPFAE